MSRQSTPSPSPDDAQSLVLARELRVLFGILKRRLREQGTLGDLTPSQVAVLARLDSDGPATITRLAQGEGVRPQSMGATVAALEALGLVAGAPDPDDGRQTLWSLTAACRNRIKAGRAAREDWLFRAIQRTLAADEKKQLARAVDLLKRVINS